MSSSTLIETVSINYEDFSESFLTCSTCLCPYDQTGRRPKLLACSHTVCSLCLERIVQLPQAVQTGSFRCPICREVHQTPRNGVTGLPPSFLVNQLIDLMQRQRRDVVPKCSAHPVEELLFCETCDSVFCPICSDPADASSGCHNHTIVPFSIAIKRMSEILLYKVNQCVKNLNKASDNVQRETIELDRNVDRILDQMNMSFQELSLLLDKRRRELVEKVRNTRDEKRRVLQEQMAIIQSEKAKVEQECNGLQCQIEVRNITRKIGDLNQRTDATLTLMEPRENAFLRYDSSTDDVLKGIQLALRHFGAVSVSRTFPPLCSMQVDSRPAAHLESTVVLKTVDYNGQSRQTGGDPVEAGMTPLDGELGEEVEGVETVGVRIRDNDDGTYHLVYRPPETRWYRLDVRIFGRPISNSPVSLHVTGHHSPVWQFGSVGNGDSHLCQPVKVCCDPDGRIIVLDTGNDRVKMVNSDGCLVHQWAGDGLNQGSAVGLALLPGMARELLTLNWRTKTVTKWSSSGQELQTVTFSEFVEPIDLAVDGCGRVLVADNGARKVFVFDGRFRPLFSFPVIPPPTKSRRQSVGRNDVTCIAVGINEDILVGGCSSVQLFDCTGKFVRTVDLTPKNDSSFPPLTSRSRPILIGGVTVDRRSGTILAIVSDRNRNSLAVCSYKGDFDFSLDSFGSKLKRPSGVCLDVDGQHCYVADLGNHCIKKYRYR